LFSAAFNFIEYLFGGWPSFKWDVRHVLPIAELMGLYGSKPWQQGNVRSLTLEQLHEFLAEP